MRTGIGGAASAVSLGRERPTLRRFEQRWVVAAQLQRQLFFALGAIFIAGPEIDLGKEKMWSGMLGSLSDRAFQFLDRLLPAFQTHQDVSGRRLFAND